MNVTGNNPSHEKGLIYKALSGKIFNSKYRKHYKIHFLSYNFMIAKRFSRKVAKLSYEHIQHEKDSTALVFSTIQVWPSTFAYSTDPFDKNFNSHLFRKSIFGQSGPRDV